MNKAQRSRNNRLGRNDPCFCGSGLKFKKCCLPKQLTATLLPGLPPPEVMEAMRVKQLEADREKRELESHGIFIPLLNTIGFKGKRGLVIGSQILFDGNENSTFMELILRELERTLGEDWWREESAKPAEEQHFIMRCYREYMKFTQEATERLPEGKGRWSAIPNGYAQSLVSLAFDVYLLQHKHALPDDWLRRLRLRDQYQGVRYEIAVASIFVRIGCALEFYEDRRGTAKHAEFKAFDQTTGAKVAVEAKSRHRNGVLHQEGDFDAAKAIKGDLTGLFNNALQKDTEGLPYLIFLDVNTPRDVNTRADETRWYADVRKMIAHQHTATASDPDQYALVSVTNYSHHYEGPDLVSASQTCVIMPLYSVAPFPGSHQGTFFAKLRAAIDGYGFVPNL